MNKLYFGDNLEVLRQHIKDESVDLVYLDPPFNSNANYNVLFKERGDRMSEAQAEAFRDTWAWGPASAIAYDELVRGGGSLANLITSLRGWLGDTGMMAYLAMMAVRLVEMHRALKETGSLYLHCDPTASHYLKIILDSIFQHSGFRNEIIWKRTTAHSGAKKFSPVHDVILYYAKTERVTWNNVRLDYDQAYLDKYYKFDDGDGRLYWRADICAAGTRNGESGKPWRGIDPRAKGMHWKYAVKTLDELDKQGRIYWSPKPGSMPQYKRYREELKGLAVSDFWDDIDRINPVGRERLGYPTQKPLALLERIISASSKPGDVILDPFCGCGTTVEAAEKLNREWVGIDVTHYAVTLIEKRLKSYQGTKFQVVGRPTDLSGAQDLARRDKYQFQWWASWLLGAQTYETKKGADRGIDGNIYFLNGPYGHGRIIVSVKGGDQLTPSMVRDLAGVVDREKAEMGILITLVDPSKAMKGEAAGHGFVAKSAHGRLPRVQIATVEDLLDGRFPKLPPIPRPTAQPRRKSAKERDQLELLFPFEGDGIRTRAGAFIDPAWVSPGKKAS